MKSNLNNVLVQGWLYQANRLEVRVSGESSKNPGTEYIRGGVDIATNNDKTNIVTVNFNYVPKTKNDKPNQTFTLLKQILDGELGTLTNPATKDSAAKVRVIGSLGLNDFMSDRNGKAEMVSAKRVEGGMIYLATELPENDHERATFDVDAVIVGAVRKEAVVNDAGREVFPEKVELDCRLFAYNNSAILPMKLSVLKPGAMDYFEDQNPTKAEPLYTRIKGEIVSEEIERQIVLEGAFGDDVRTVKNSHRDMVVTWAASNPYEFGEEDVLTGQDLQTMAAARATHLAEIEDRFKNRPQAVTATPVAPKQSTGVYNF